MRLIDADALMEAIRTDVMGGLNYESFIKEAPTIDVVPRWIPCEERLPEKENPYRRRDFYLTTNAYGVVNVTTYEFENDFQKRGWQSDIRIIAWMPLPEPYDGERKDDEIIRHG